MEAKIILEKDLHTDLGMRYLAEMLFENLDNNVPKITIDFNGITFMSRSFAQEYVFQKNQLKNIEFVEENMDVNVKKMFEVVYDSMK